MKTVMLLLLLAALGLWWMSYENGDLSRRLSAAHQTIAIQEYNLSSAKKQLAALSETAKRNERAQVKLRQQLAAAQRLDHRRTQRITRRLNENEMLRHWYHSLLPDDIARLHARPRFDHPADYLRWMSDGGELPDTGQPTQNERRSQRR